MYLTRDQVRDLDRRAIEEFGIPGIVLMENAGREAAEILLTLGVNGPVLICCGKGNNGGDGLVIARHLDNRRIPVRVLLFASADQLSEDAATNFNIIIKSGISSATLLDHPRLEHQLGDELRSAAWVVDALFGTGLTRPLQEPFDRVVNQINQKAQRVVAVDIPSGLDCDTGKPLGPTIRARHTVTFVAQKKGFANPQASEWTGQIHVAGIGAPRVLLGRGH